VRHLLYQVYSHSFIKGLSLGMAETRQQARQTKAGNRAEEIRAYKADHPESTTRLISEVLGVSAMTVSRALKGL
jgi:hypothetical protein